MDPDEFLAYHRRRHQRRVDWASIAMAGAVLVLLIVALLALRGA